MFNSPALNVVIGLVLIFLLYSLLATILGEMISFKLGIRPRILRMAIERMLNDGYYKKFYPTKIVISKSGKAVRKTTPSKTSRYFTSLGQRISYIILLRTPKAFPSSFAGRFYESPSVKFLARLEADQKGLFGISKPSYLSAENFAETLCHILEEGGSGKTTYDKIIFCIKYNTLQIQPETAKHIANLIKDSPDIDAFKLSLQRWFNETMDRANGWYKSKMQGILLCLGFLIAWCFNIDTIKIAQILSKDRDASEQLTSIAVATAKDTAHYGAFVNGQPDSLHTKAILDSGLAQVNKDISESRLILGLGWNLDSLKTKDAKKISRHKDSAAYAEALQHYNNLQTLYKAYPAQARELTGTQQKLDSSWQMLKRLKRDTLTNAIQRKNNDSAKAAFLFTSKVIDAYKNLKTLDSAQLAETRNRITQEERSILNTISSDIVQVDTITTSADTLEITGKRNYSFWGKIWYILWAHPHSWLRFLGFLLTALAISLGAPFWFDLLNKLINIRIAGVKPEEKEEDPNKKNLLNATDNTTNKDNSTSEPAQVILNEETAIQEALRIYSDTIRKEAGVIRVDKGYMQDENKNVIKCVQVDVENNESAIKVRSIFPALKLSNTSVPVNVLVTGEARLAGGAIFSTNAGNFEKALSNQTGLHGWGSFGCLVENVDNVGEYLIVSCYHVMNGDFTWGNDGNNRVIQKQKNDIVSNTYQGHLTSTLDIAYAPVTGNALAFYQNLSDIDIPIGIREVTDEDILKTTVKLQGFATSLATGIIADNSKPMQFPYPIRRGVALKRQLEDLLVISHSPINNAQSFVPAQRGDSGAIVLDENNIALGIVVGTDLTNTYAIKITTIFNQLGFKLPS